VISGAFNNKSVHFVGVIIVRLSTCTERQQLKLKIEVFTQITVRIFGFKLYEKVSVSLKRTDGQTESLYVELSRMA
jgi:hypothetical protein